VVLSETVLIECDAFQNGLISRSEGCGFDIETLAILTQIANSVLESVPDEICIPSRVNGRWWPEKRDVFRNFLLIPGSAKNLQPCDLPTVCMGSEICHCSPFSL
jgi:hypothetical protein